jgi:hypothetical protein
MQKIENLITKYIHYNKGDLPKLLFKKINNFGIVFTEKLYQKTILGNIFKIQINL